MPRWFRRLSFILFAVLTVAIGSLVAFGKPIAGMVARTVIARIVQVAATRRIEFRDVRFGEARLIGFGVVRCDDVSGTVQVDLPGETLSGRRAFAFAASNVVVDLGWPWSGRAAFNVLGGRIQAIDAGDGGRSEEDMTQIRAQVQIPFSWAHPRESVGLVEKEIRRLVRDGRTMLPLKLEAVTGFTAARHRHELPIHTEGVAGGGVRIALERSDIEHISREYTHKLTATEIDLVARYPQRAPALLRFCEQASHAAANLWRRDHTFPQDAFRHVYWSWLLTREFGPDFSEEATDAHEIGATYESGATNRRMDLHNNAVGRAYAIAGVSEQELVNRVRTDPNVLQRPDRLPQGGP